MRLVYFLALSLLFTAPALRAQDVSYVPQVGDGEIAGIQLITEFIFVNSGGPAQVNLAFKRTDGNPMSLNLVGIGAVTEHDFALAAGESASFATMGVGGPSVGYAVVTAVGPLAGGGGATSVGGTAVFIQKDTATGTVFNEAGVPLVKGLTEFSLFVDTTGSRNTALALVHAGSGVKSPSGTGPVADTIQLNLFDKLFNFIATTDIPLMLAQQINGFVPDLFDPELVPQVTEMEGSLTVSSMAAPAGGVAPPPLAGLTVRTNNAGGSFPDVVPTFTAFPVVPGAATLASSGLDGVVTREPSGSLRVDLDLRSTTRPITGAIFFISQEGRLIRELVRSIDSDDFASFVFELPAGSEPAGTEKVEVCLIYGGGEITPRIPIE